MGGGQRFRGSEGDWNLGLILRSSSGTKKEEASAVADVFCSDHRRLTAGCQAACVRGLCAPDNKPTAEVFRPLNLQDH